MNAAPPARRRDQTLLVAPDQNESVPETGRSQNSTGRSLFLASLIRFEVITTELLYRVRQCPIGCRSCETQSVPVQFPLMASFAGLDDSEICGRWYNSFWPPSLNSRAIFCGLSARVAGLSRLYGALHKGLPGLVASLVDLPSVTFSRHHQ